MPEIQKPLQYDPSQPARVVTCEHCFRNATLTSGVPNGTFAKCPHCKNQMMITATSRNR